MTSDLLDVTVKVPASRLAEFYETFGRWLEEPTRSGGDKIAEAGPSQATDRTRWDPDTDLEIATQAWAGFPMRAKALLSTLIDNPERRFSGEQLAAMHAIPNGKYGVAGVWAWPGRQLRALDRPLPFVAEAEPGEGSAYSMTLKMAELFSEARRRVDGG